MSFIAGVLITGSLGAPPYPPNPPYPGNSAELYVPSIGASCSLPMLPQYIAFHTVSESGLLCGFYECLLWSPDSGSWEAAVTLDVKRSGHVSWTPISSPGTYLIGGDDDESWRTSTLITPDASQEPGFVLKYDTQ